MTGTLEALKGRLVVSCQAYPGEPMRHAETMARIAQACVLGGAAAIRVQGIEDIRATTAVVDVPVIGLWKDGAEGVYITPTLRHALACAEAGARIVAIDATSRPRPDGSTFAEIVRGLKEAHPKVLVMADCGSLEDCLRAETDGADIIGTTLAGYSGERPKTDGPDLELARQAVAACRRPVIVEGRVHTLDQARAVMATGAWAVCVGTAITHPSSITGWFAAAVQGS
ncbi:N-acetylmannosamine-6-phosphate 2-epimerase [Arachnia propionica]|uniref:Putative N-acetylmannosamine-6-phosphate 2-epimerase n=1 Tax=Arachnia propionica TaxID=1750 RepID=A0A3P1TDS8_9ACTN|nr:N-acetylmannosamine-6-phosphate 2-epimerase [Arachnia propionica]MDO5081884.1 N-acetylmannosamine-6-phosphate 2-epimerase [Arachnia propionica]RRD07265.1 N-acetylmannosamine-6-phosphate 2-epimerase [Arachnia propionica]